MSIINQNQSVTHGEKILNLSFALNPNEMTAFEDLKHTFGIHEGNLSVLSEDAKDFALHKGIVMRTLDLPKDARVPVPFCIVPSCFPQKLFDYAVELQQHINYLLYTIAHSKEFLQECLASTIETDEFTANIFKIYEAVEKRNNQQPSLGLIRSDYLMNHDSEDVGIKQIENNTIAASFGGLSPSVRDLHEHILEKLGVKDFDCKMPFNDSASDLAKGVVMAWDYYENKSAAVLFVVEEVTTNIGDQRAIEYAISELESQIEVLRCTFAELRTHLKVLDNKLYVKEKEVAVVYYRVGYMPEHYELQDWETRLEIERSHAIKCPSVGLHLAGTKKVQLCLAQPGMLERFLPCEVADKLRRVFASQYSLDMDEAGDQAVELGMANPSQFVLKPEREGGGNNKYGEDLRSFLQEIGSTQQRQAYILMERVIPPVVSNCIIQSNKAPQPCSITCELGIYGVILGSGDKIYYNYNAGHVLRSKATSSNEGGIVAGFGALDSPYLT